MNRCSTSKLSSISLTSYLGRRLSGCCGLGLQITWYLIGSWYLGMICDIVI
jgi:hypothetical protein